MNSQKPPSGLVIYVYFLYFFKVRTGPNRPRRVTGGLIKCIVGWSFLATAIRPYVLDLL